MTLNFDFKFHRAAVIQCYLHESGRSPRVVVATCGNAARKLRKVGLSVVEIGSGNNADFIPTKWMTPAEIAATFPTRFDATSGHLPFHLMLKVAEMLRKKIPHSVAQPQPGGEIYVHSGSGESAIITALAYPGAKVIAVFNDSEPATTYDRRNILHEYFTAFGIEMRLEGRTV
jgi:hypothetical protein